jgi:MYXO-CTERM domain-containing protein
VALLSALAPAIGITLDPVVRRKNAWLGGLAALLVSAPLLANGRFPEAQKLIEDPRDPNRLLLAGTYGLLVSQDRGQNWYYLCEEAFALELIEGDPLLELLPNGEMLAGLIATLNRSTDCGCTWSTRLAQPETVVLRDITVEKSGDRAAIALTRDVGANPEVFSLHESKDAGQTWTKLADLPADVEEAFTVDSAPSDASRIYVSALMKSGSGALLVSTNRGAAWQARTMAGADINNQAYIAAVHPTKPDTVFIRTNGWDDESLANDALFYTDNAGQSFVELIRHAGKLFGFALSPDASTVLAGYGDPYQAASFVNTDELGIYKAPIGQKLTTRIFAGAISCLTWTSRGVYACHAEEHPDFMIDFGLGFAPNADFTEATASPFTPLMRKRDVRGPLGCAASVCANAWSMPSELGDAVCKQLGAQCDGPAGSTAPPCGAGSSTGGTGGSGATGGSGDAAGGAGGVGGAGGTGATGGGDSGVPGGTGGGMQGSGGRGGTGPAAGGGDDSGCGCRTESDSQAGLWMLLGALPLFSFLRRRKGRKG